jgi:DNA-binding response OmpR family regulator
VLEDDKYIVELMKYYLEEEGYEIKFSLKGDNFLRKVLEYQPDLITLDMHLGDSKGLNILDSLKKDQHTKHIPVVFVTAMEMSMEEAKNMGGAGYIAKPFDGNELKIFVHYVLNGEKK